MQKVLTFAFEAVFLVGSGYLFIGFILGLVDLWDRSHPDVAVSLRRSDKVPYQLPAATQPPVGESIKQTIRQKEYEPIDTEQ